MTAFEHAAHLAAADARKMQAARGTGRPTGGGNTDAAYRRGHHCGYCVADTMSIDAWLRTPGETVATYAAYLRGFADGIVEAHR